MTAIVLVFNLQEKGESHLQQQRRPRGACAAATSETWRTRSWAAPTSAAAASLATPGLRASGWTGRDLFDAYAHCADRRDAEGQMALFAPGARFAVYMSGEGSEPTYVLEGREALSPVFADLNQYDVTTHFNGQSTVTLDGDTAAGECYTIAHHLSTADGDRKIMIASLRYLDTYSKVDGAWYFAERKLIVDWMETRTSIAP